MIHIIMETGGQLNVLGLEAGTIMGDVTLFSLPSVSRREPASPKGSPKTSIAPVSSPSACDDRWVSVFL